MTSYSLVRQFSLALGSTFPALRAIAHSRERSNFPEEHQRSDISLNAWMDYYAEELIERGRLKIPIEQERSTRKLGKAG
jgi:hypothetical protein